MYDVDGVLRKQMGVRRVSKKGKVANGFFGPKILYFQLKVLSRMRD